MGHDKNGGPDFLAKVKIAPNKYLASTLQSWQGKLLFHLRFWSERNGELTPWKTGLTLWPEDYPKLKKLLDDTEHALLLKVAMEQSEEDLHV